MVGALGFGWLADRLGRRRLFFVTLIVYMLASIATGFAWDFWSFALFRALTGAGIGGEYAAVNSAIQELIPARCAAPPISASTAPSGAGRRSARWWRWWCCDPAIIDPEIGWRAAFVVGGALSLVVLLLRRYLPESPRWLMLHGRPEEAGRIVGDIERDVAAQHGPLPPPAYGTVVLHRRGARLASARSGRPCSAPTGPRDARPGADVLPGLLLQRGLLHLCAGADQVLRHPGPADRLVHAALRARQPGRARCCSGGSSTPSAASR